MNRDAVDIRRLPSASPYREPNCEWFPLWSARWLRARLRRSVRRGAGLACEKDAAVIVDYMIQDRHARHWLSFGPTITNAFTATIGMCDKCIFSDGAWWWTLSTIIYLDVYSVPVKPAFENHVFAVIGQPGYRLQAVRSYPWVRRKSRVWER